MIEKLHETFPFLYQTDAWILQIFFIIFTALLFDFIQKKVFRRIQKQFEKTPNLWDDALVHAIIKPLSVLIWLSGISLAMDVAKFSNSFKVFEVGCIISFSWTLIRLITFIEKNVINQQKIKGKKVDKTTADAVSQILRLSVVITSTLVGLQTLGFNISAILAFGGIGGIAVGFAAKDLLANFFGGLMIYLDRPFSVGDWIRSPDRNIEGTVEKIGWRLTLIRTFDKRPLYIPNSMFASISVENPSRMTHRRINETIGVRYDDIQCLEKIINEVKEMLAQHPEIDNTQTLMVNFNKFAASSLDFFIYTFTKTTNWIKFHEVKQDVLFKITDIVERNGAEIAFPTSTIHIENDALLKQLS
ncbi:MAG: mechanosensitive ion channel family protein [Woeseiaceae bacterium]